MDHGVPMPVNETTTTTTNKQIGVDEVCPRRLPQQLAKDERKARDLLSVRSVQVQVQLCAAVLGNPAHEKVYRKHYAEGVIRMLTDTRTTCTCRDPISRDAGCDDPDGLCPWLCEQGTKDLL